MVEGHSAVILTPTGMATYYFELFCLHFSMILVCFYILKLFYILVTFTLILYLYILLGVSILVHFYSSNSTKSSNNFPSNYIIVTITFKSQYVSHIALIHGMALKLLSNLNLRFNLKLSQLTSNFLNHYLPCEANLT